MEKETEKVVAAPEESEKQKEKVVEVEDLDANLKEEDIEAVKKYTEEKVIEQHVLNPQQQGIFKQIMDEASMPVKMTDGKFALGENELDIRYLSKANKEQMMFRTHVLSNVYSKQMLTSLIDITRLLMIICDKLGVTDIVAATDEVLERIGRLEDAKKVLKKDETKEEENKA